MSIAYNYENDILIEGATTERFTTKEIKSSIEFSRSKGIYIPMPFFRDLDITNKISFTANVDYAMNEKLVAYEKVESIEDMTIDEFDTKLTIGPKINYHFSQWVTGNIFYNKIIINNLETGASTEDDIGFNITIQIRG